MRKRKKTNIYIIEQFGQQLIDSSESGMKIAERRENLSKDCKSNGASAIRSIFLQEDWLTETCHTG
jgi:hypothetical protein